MMIAVMAMFTTGDYNVATDNVESDDANDENDIGISIELTPDTEYRIQNDGS